MKHKKKKHHKKHHAPKHHGPKRRSPKARREAEKRLHARLHEQHAEVMHHLHKKLHG
jgi:hypothetical protein